jgi:hypothetical protein
MRFPMATVKRKCTVYEIGQNLCEPNYYIIGDAAYPCKSWVMTPFRNNGHLTPAEVYYNTQLSKTRVVVENAFALLKGRFRRLKYMLETHCRLYQNNSCMLCST